MIHSLNISKVYDIGLKKYRDYEIRVCGKDVIYFDKRIYSNLDDRREQIIKHMFNLKKKM